MSVLARVRDVGLSLQREGEVVVIRDDTDGRVIGAWERYDLARAVFDAMSRQMRADADGGDRGDRS